MLEHAGYKKKSHQRWPTLAKRKCDGSKNNDKKKSWYLSMKKVWRDWKSLIKYTRLWWYVFQHHVSLYGYEGQPRVLWSNPGVQGRSPIKSSQNTSGQQQYLVLIPVLKSNTHHSVIYCRGYLLFNIFFSPTCPPPPFVAMSILDLCCLYRFPFFILIFSILNIILADTMIWNLFSMS